MEPKAKGRELGLKGTGSSSPLQNITKGLLSLYKHAGIYCMLWFNFILGSIFILLCFFVW